MNLKSDAKVRWIFADSKELQQIFFELLRRSGGSATKGQNRVKCCRKQRNSLIILRIRNYCLLLQR
jgi:hypothetical protein